MALLSPTIVYCHWNAIATPLNNHRTHTMEELGISPSTEHPHTKIDTLTALSANGGTALTNNANSNANTDVYLKLKKLEKELELIHLQEDYIKDEQRYLKRELVRAQEEVKKTC
jgi:26S proteasome regulatory subunit T3